MTAEPANQNLYTMGFFRFWVEFEHSVASLLLRMACDRERLVLWLVSCCARAVWAEGGQCTACGWCMMNVMAEGGRSGGLTLKTLSLPPLSLLSQLGYLPLSLTYL